MSLDLALGKPHALLTGVTAAPDIGFTPLPRGYRNRQFLGTLLYLSCTPKKKPQAAQILT